MALTRYGMALPPDRPMSDMPAYVNDAGPETPAKNPVDYWAEKNAALIQAQVRAAGWAAVDLSGTASPARSRRACSLAAGDAAGWPFTVEAIRRTLAQVGSEPNDRWVFWANPSRPAAPIRGSRSPSSASSGRPGSPATRRSSPPTWSAGTRPSGSSCTTPGHRRPALGDSLLAGLGTDARGLDPPVRLVAGGRENAGLTP